MQVINQRSSSATQTARGSSKPHCSLSIPLAGASSGSGSIDHAVEAVRRARDGRDARCPVRSSTRASSTVSPSTSAAAGLKTTLTGVRPIGRGQDRVAGMPPEELVVRVSRGLVRASRSVRSRGRPAASSTSCGTVEGKRRLGAFVVVDVGLAEAVAAPAGREVVERPVRAGFGRGTSRTPLRARAPCSRVAGDGERRSSASTNADASSGCSSPAPGRRLVAVAPTMAGQPQDALRRARTRHRARRASSSPISTAVVAPSAVPPRISACGRRALS